jgi:hypothetical protein
VTVATSTGKTAVTQVQALDFGTPLDRSLCSGITSLHEAYWDLSDGNGSDRSQIVSITTTLDSDYNANSGYDPNVCFYTSKPFTQLVLVQGVRSLAPATAIPLGGGKFAYQGLLPDCGNKPLQPNQVDCSKNPGLRERGATNTNSDGTTATSVIAVPPGFDARAYN